MSNPEIKVDANKVINNLIQQVAGYVKEVAIQQATIEELQIVNEKQQELINAYEDKEKAADK